MAPAASKAIAVEVVGWNSAAVRVTPMSRAG